MYSRGPGSHPVLGQCWTRLLEVSLAGVVGLAGDFSRAGVFPLAGVSSLAGERLRASKDLDWLFAFSNLSGREV